MTFGMSLNIEDSSLVEPNPDKDNLEEVKKRGDNTCEGITVGTHIVEMTVVFQLVALLTNSFGVEVTVR